MNELRFTLISDGSSDRALLPVLRWLLAQNGLAMPVSEQWADWSHFRTPPRRLSDKIKKAIDLYPCDLLFVHRDAERAPAGEREAEIESAVSVLGADGVPSVVAVIPVRMMEAWLLIDEGAIREAAGNPNGDGLLSLPPLAKLESLPNPKETLHGLLRQASGLHGRRLHQLRIGPAIHRLANLIEDFSPLRKLPAFAQLEDRVRDYVVAFRL